LEDKIICGLLGPSSKVSDTSGRRENAQIFITGISTSIVETRTLWLISQLWQLSREPEATFPSQFILSKYLVKSVPFLTGICCHL